MSVVVLVSLVLVQDCPCTRLFIAQKRIPMLPFALPEWNKVYGTKQRCDSTFNLHWFHSTILYAKSSWSEAATEDPYFQHDLVPVDDSLRKVLLV